MIPSGPAGLLSLSDAAQIEAVRYHYDHRSSSHAFNTLYIWRRFVGAQLYLEDDLFTLQYIAKGANTWLFPCGDSDAAFRFISAHLAEPDFSLCYLREQDVQWLENHFPGLFVISPSAGDNEYIVSRQGHIACAGKRYEKLRNKIHRAERDHTITIKPLNDENVGEALEIIRLWRGSRTAGGVLEMYGDEEDTEPLMKREQLGIRGILMYADGAPFGVAAGYMLSDDTFDLFLAKECVKDPCLGYYMRRELMRLLPENVRFVNLEDDLEIEGLRVMKKQMLPEKINEMWTAVRHEG